MTLYKQIVQRLGGYDLPSVLKNNITYTEDLLQEREVILHAASNSKALTNYRNNLPSTFNKFQRSYAIGLILSDASIQYSTKKGEDGRPVTARFKLQQANFHEEFLKATYLVFLPWVRTICDISTRPMSEVDTLQSKAVKEIADLFQDPNVEPKPQAYLHKRVPKNIEKELDPVCIAIWFCGDGGRRDYGINQGKAIQLHTQGFLKEDTELLAKSLENRYGWNVQVKEDRGYYLIQIEASSFDDFMNTVGPFILPTFEKRLPRPRKKKR